MKNRVVKVGELSDLPPALRFALQCGWFIVPLHWVTAGKCSCNLKECQHAGKHPLIGGGFKRASSNLVQILDWLERWPSANWGVATGSISGVFVLDVDGPKGREGLTELEKCYGPLPRTLAVSTGRTNGGSHVYFKLAESQSIPSSSGKIADGLDVRADGGYAVIPPSTHESGKSYEYIENETPFAPLPPWLATLALQAKQRSAKNGPIPRGERNGTLMSIGGAIRRQGYSESRILTELSKINQARCLPPLPGEEVRRIVLSLMRPAYDPMNSPQSGPLEQFIYEALAKNRIAFDANQNLVTPLFQFARSIRSRHEFANMDGIQAAQMIDAALVTKFGETDAWELATGEDIDDPRMDFIRSFESVQVPGDGNSLEIAYQDALKFPLKPICQFSRGYVVFVSMVGSLQRSRPGAAIYLPNSEIGTLLKCDRKTVGTYRKYAVEQGLLIKTANYVAKKLADEFLFRSELFDSESGVQIERGARERDGLKRHSPDLGVNDAPQENENLPPSHVVSAISGESGESGGSFDSHRVLKRLVGVKVAIEQQELEDRKESTPAGQSSPPRTEGSPLQVADPSESRETNLGRETPPLPSRVGSNPQGENAPTPAFPCCPGCYGFALYREGNIGNFECLSCALQGITEIAARKASRDWKGWKTGRNLAKGVAAKSKKFI